MEKRIPSGQEIQPPLNQADKPALETGFDANFDPDGSYLSRFADGFLRGVLTEADRAKKIELPRIIVELYVSCIYIW